MRDGGDGNRRRSDGEDERHDALAAAHPNPTHVSDGLKNGPIGL